MSANTAPDATALVMDSAPGFTSLLEAAGAAALPRWQNVLTPPLAAGFDNRPTWDNPTPAFDNRPSWDNWKNK
ncbi:multiple cyclophane-containing RiPP AmcA [Streptomyces sp. CC228A]|uniref:multiple cyclophane-containing RiPP AmcA n=1 Tax=Streptomyces sp. CC228A TaxID=2898186 RepID=UPI001F15973B|nr:multiple cyclophane-containing RiPP AmcA [Streptomyces sp. CC228A]